MNDSCNGGDQNGGALTRSIKIGYDTMQHSRKCAHKPRLERSDGDACNLWGRGCSFGARVAYVVLYALGVWLNAPSFGTSRT